MTFHILLIWTLVVKVSGSDIIFNGVTRRPQFKIVYATEPVCKLSTENEDKRILICYCSKLKELHLGHELPSAKKIFSRYFYEKANGLELILCEKVFLHSDLSWLRHPQSLPIRWFTVNGVSSFYLTGVRALNFEFQVEPVSISFYRLGNPFLLPDSFMFGGQIESLKVDSVHWIDFNSNNLFGISSNATVEIKNCHIQTADPGSQSSRRTIDKMSFFNTTMKSVGHGALNLTVSAIDFDSCDLDLVSERAFDLRGCESVEFTNSVVGLQARSLMILTESLLFQNVTLTEMKTLSLAQVHPKSYDKEIKGSLIFEDVLLIDPSRGSLVSGFYNVIFRNVTVSSCICELEEYLLDSSMSIFTLRMMLEIEEELLRNLKNNTLCFDGISKSFVKSFCEIVQKSIDITYASVISFLFVGIIGVIATIITVYLLNKRGRERRLMLIKDWAVALPRPKSYRETAVRFDLQSVETIPRPKSFCYMEQQNESETEHCDSMDEEDGEDDRKNPNFKKALSIILEETDDFETVDDFQNDINIVKISSI